MVTPTEYGLALAAIIAILFFVGCCSDAEYADDRGCGCCLAAIILLLATLYLIYFFFRFTISILS